MFFKSIVIILFTIFGLTTPQETTTKVSQETIDCIWGEPEDCPSSSTTESVTPTITPRYPVSSTTPSPNKECICLSFDHCNTTINENGEGLIDIRVMDCPSSVEVCCDPKDIINPPKPTPPPRPKGCGYRNGNGVGFRIVSLVDHEAEFGEFPWMIAVYQREPFGGNPRSGKEVDYLCGGALIHPKVVVTVAHCVKNKKVQLTVRAGEWDTQTDKELYPQQDRDVASVTIHPQYYSGGYHNDIALLFLEDPVELAPHINVVCLPPQDTVVDDARCFSSGWGKDVFGKEGRRQVILKKIDLPMMPRGQCQENLRKTRLGSHFKLHQSFVCAGGEKGKDTCTGDGGGPLACPIQGYHERYFQVGIVAWGVGCGDYNVPGVYVHVAHFRKWIDEQLIRKHLNINTYQF